MKINAVISKPSINVNSANKSAIISAAIIAIGIIIGSIIFIVSKNTLADSLLDYFVSFSVDFANKNNLNFQNIKPHRFRWGLVYSYFLPAVKPRPQTSET